MDRGDCDLGHGVGLHLRRAADIPERQQRRRYAPELAVLVVIPRSGNLFLELGNGQSAAIAACGSTWVVNLEQGASLVGAPGTKYSSLKITLSALECLATGCGVRLNSFPMMGEYPSDAVLENFVDALAEHITVQPAEQGGSADFCHAIGTAIKYHILRTYGDQGSGTGQTAGALAPWQLHVVKEAMLARLDSKLDAEKLARLCGISTSHLRRAFLASTGQSIHRWVVRQRVDQACGDLLSTSLPMAEIALRWGFSDQSHLTRTFAALLGMTPARWRRAHSSSEASPVQESSRP
ncbi:AraC family transcriptional regulator [Dyella sp. C11]|uniref:helix-turn-helix domain-containing protein n=1 Tax=Dyella sp. C11 TaxID=2126991 RepID=UPI00130029F2|nr:AraC family transcriptional regulator [Dyella sp. C11]